MWQLRLAPLAKLEAREGVRQGWSDIITKHLNEGAPLPISISEQTKQVGLGGERGRQSVRCTAYRYWCAPAGDASISEAVVRQPSAPLFLVC